MEKKVILKFEADWCGPCQQFKPIIARLSENYAEDLKIQSVDVDDVNSAYLIDKYQIKSIPMLILTDGSETLARLRGLTSYQHLENWVAPHLTAVH